MRKHHADIDWGAHNTRMPDNFLLTIADRNCGGYAVISTDSIVPADVASAEGSPLETNVAGKLGDVDMKINNRP
jgi:hypothetical protein